MSIFRSIVFSAALSGLVVGAAVTGIQHLGTVPLILKGEVYEDEAKAAEVKSAEAKAAEVKAAELKTAELKPAETPSAPSTAHEHAEAAWEPHEGLERNAYTAVANILTAIGFALLLGGFFALRGKPVTAREGLFWGLAGFTVFTLAPGLGLPPELPGIPSAPVEQRQLWWIATAAATGAGLYLLIFQRAAWAGILAIALIAVPHVVGAPQLAEMHTNVPEALSRQFVAAVTVTSLIFWALLRPADGDVSEKVC